MSKSTHAAGLVAEALLRKADRERIERELARKQWTRSEAEALQAELAAAGDVAALQAYDTVIRQAAAEGRLRDDLAFTAENVAARQGGGMYLTSAELMIVREFAAHLDRGPTGDGRLRMHRDAAAKLLQTLADRGAIVADGPGASTGGRLYEIAAPTWLKPGFMAGSWVRGTPTDPRELRMAEAQRARWAALEAHWNQALSSIIKGGELPPMREGASWRAHDTVEDFEADATHAASTKRAAAELKREARAAAATALEERLAEMKAAASTPEEAEALAGLEAARAREAAIEASISENQAAQFPGSPVHSAWKQANPGREPRLFGEQEK